MRPGIVDLFAATKAASGVPFFLPRMLFRFNTFERGGLFAFAFRADPHFRRPRPRHHHAFENMVAIRTFQSEYRHLKSLGPGLKTHWRKKEGRPGDGDAAAQLSFFNTPIP